MPELKSISYEESRIEYFRAQKAHLFVDNGIRVFCVQCGASSKVLRDMQTAKGVAGNATKSVIDAWNRRAEDENAG